MTFIVPAVLGGLAILVAVTVSVIASIRQRRKASAQTQASSQPRILVHSINDDRCVGCDACVAVCPTNVLDLVDNKSRVLRFEDCIQCEACMWACPTEALVMHLEGSEPPRLKVPDIDETFQTPVQGQYLIGEVSGKPLVKNAANLGRMVVEHMLQNGLQKGAGPAPGGADASVDVAIVGSGPAGLSTALSCIYHGLSYVVLEKEQLVASTIARYPKGKLVMAEPYDVVNRSFLPVFDSSKEQIVPIWEDLIGQTGLEIKKGEAVEDIKKDDGSGIFHVRTTVAQYYAQRVVLAIGSRGKPRTLNVQGENLPKVHSLLEDPDDHRGQSVLVVGGGDSALEAAIALADAGAHVSISYRSKGFNRAAPKNKATIESYQAQRRIDVYFQSQVDHITEDTLTLNLPDGQKEIKNDATFVLIGADPPTKWLEKVGVGVVDKPHQFQLGKSDEKLAGFLGDSAPVCPESAAGAAALLRGETPAEAQPAAEEAGARGWLKSATQIFAPQKAKAPSKTTTTGVPLGEFANRRHTGDGRRDMLDPAERTRVLRMLRDVGGRMADEAPEPDAAPGAAGAAGAQGDADPLEADRFREAGLRGVTYPSIDIPKVPGLTQVLDAADPDQMAAAAQAGSAQQAQAPGGGAPAPPMNQTMMGVPSQAGSPGGGHGLESASQLREQAKQKQPEGAGAASFPQDARTIVEMAVPQELLKHSVGAKRKQGSEEQTIVSDPRLFSGGEDRTQFSPPSAKKPAASAGDEERTQFAATPAMAESGAGDPKKTLMDPTAGPPAASGPAQPGSQKQTLFDPRPPEHAASGGQANTAFAPGGAPSGGGPGSPRAGDHDASSAQADWKGRTHFGAGPGHAQGPASGGDPGGAGQPQESADAPDNRKTLFGMPDIPKKGEEEGEGSSQGSVRSVNAQFEDEATTTADVSELVRKMSEERKRRDK